MASYTIAAGEKAAHNKTLVASTVDTVTVTVPSRCVEVVNLSGTAAIYFTIDGSAPTVGGNSTYVVPASISSRTVSTDYTKGVVSAVKLISAGTPVYSVQAV